jgi:hypothetical protein
VKNGSGEVAENRDAKSGSGCQAAKKGRVAGFLQDMKAAHVVCVTITVALLFYLACIDLQGGRLIFDQAEW